MNSERVERGRVTQRSRFLSYFDLHLLVFQVVEELPEVHVAEVQASLTPRLAHRGSDDISACLLRYGGQFFG
jgi:hypothetical protein